MASPIINRAEELHEQANKLERDARGCYRQAQAWRDTLPDKWWDRGATDAEKATLADALRMDRDGQTLMAKSIELRDEAHKLLMSEAERLEKEYNENRLEVTKREIEATKAKMKELEEKGRDYERSFES